MIFDKDDQLAKEFIAVATNIRMSSFRISLHSFFEAKGIAVEKYFFGFPFKVQLAFDFVNSCSHVVIVKAVVLQFWFVLIHVY